MSKDLLIAFLENKSFQKQSLLEKERICFKGANSFLKELTPFRRHAKMKMAQLLRLKVYPFTHTCQVLRKFKSETARAVIEHTENSEAQVIRVRFFLLLNRHKLLTERDKQYCFVLPISVLSTTLIYYLSVNLQCPISIQFLFLSTYNAFSPMAVMQIKIQKG